MPAITNPVIVQSDRSVLLEVKNPLYEDARDTLAIFAELEKIRYSMLYELQYSQREIFGIENPR